MENRKIAGAAAVLVFSLTFGAGDLRAQSQEEIALVKRVFAEWQPKSFQRNREFCGYIGYLEDGRLAATPARRGRRDSCFADDPDMLEVVIASFHTHGGYDGDAGHEVPSIEDVEGDADEGIDGWVATPGGRLWYIDTEEMEIVLICGEYCLTADEDYKPASAVEVGDFYSYDDLVEFLE